MFLIHDDDLKRIDRIGDGTVSGYSISSIVFSSLGRQSLEALQLHLVMDILRRSDAEILTVQFGELPSDVNRITSMTL
jgi:hypothetical protein